MRGEQATLIQPRLYSSSKIIEVEATVDGRMGKIQGQAIHHKILTTIRDIYHHHNETKQGTMAYV